MQQGLEDISAAVHCNRCQFEEGEESKGRLGFAGINLDLSHLHEVISSPSFWHCQLSELCVLLGNGNFSCGFRAKHTHDKPRSKLLHHTHRLETSKKVVGWVLSFGASSDSIHWFYHAYYTERQKKLTTVFFRATLTKIHLIKICNIWIQISYSSPHEAHLKNQRAAFVEKEGNAVEMAKGHFSKKSQKLLAENLQERPPIQNFQ